MLELMFATAHEHARPDDHEPAPALADIVREETDDGRLIVRFLIDVMQGRLEDSRPCHRLDAARQLIDLGFDDARGFIASNTQPSHRRAPSPESGRRGQSGLHRELAALIRQETDDGRTAIRFLVDVMQGSLHDFKPHHRLSAARELLRRGFDDTSADSAGRNDPPHDYREPPAPVLETRDPVPVSLVPESPEYSGKDDSDDRDPFDFDTYDDEDYRHDCFGHDARVRIFGSKEAVSVANRAVFDFRMSKTPAERDATESDDDASGDSPGAARGPDPYGVGSYGYKALLRCYGSKVVVRVANRAVEEYHERGGAAGPPADWPGDTIEYDPPWDASDSPDPPEDEGSEEPGPDPPRPSLRELRARGYATGDETLDDHWPGGLVIDSTTPSAAIAGR